MFDSCGMSTHRCPFLRFSSADLAVRHCPGSAGGRSCDAASTCLLAEPKARTRRNIVHPFHFSMLERDRVRVIPVHSILTSSSLCQPMDKGCSGRRPPTAPSTCQVAVNVQCLFRDLSAPGFLQLCFGLGIWDVCLFSQPLSVRKEVVTPHTGISSGCSIECHHRGQERYSVVLGDMLPGTTYDVSWTLRNQCGCGPLAPYARFTTEPDLPDTPKTILHNAPVLP